MQNEKTDTGRVLLLADLAFKYHESKPDTGMTLAIQGLELSRKIHFEKGEAVSLNRVGNVYFVLDNYPKAMAAYLQALRINEKIHNLKGEQSNLNNIGIIYRDGQSDDRTALEYLFKADSIAKLLGDKKALSTALVNIANSYTNLKILDSASQFALQAYNMAKEINYARIAGAALQRLGSINLQTGDYQLALDYCKASFPLLISAENYNNLSMVYLTTANIFDKLNQGDSVMLYAKQSYVTAKERGFTQFTRDAARFLSHYYRKYNTDSAFFYQDISKAANDSLFSQQKQRQFQSLAFDEKLRQADIAAAEIKAKEQRSHNLQYAAIAVALITFIILFLLLSRSIVVKTKFIEFFGVLGLLAVFEFINLFIHPYLSHATNDSPVLMLLILIGIGALLVPLHHRLEKWITKIMVEKNKKIRLDAAKKTIQQLEG